MAGDMTVSETLEVGVASATPFRVPTWTAMHRRQTAIIDAWCGIAAGLLAFEVRFGGSGGQTALPYFWLALSLPALWLPALGLAGAYDSRFIGVGSDEFRRVLNTGVCLTAQIGRAHV